MRPDLLCWILAVVWLVLAIVSCISHAWLWEAVGNLRNRQAEMAGMLSAAERSMGFRGLDASGQEPDIPWGGKEDSGIGEDAATWQPIETAPKDKRIVCLLPHAEEGFEAVFLIWKTNPRTGLSYFGDPIESDDYDLAEAENQPQFWFPLPEMPVGQGEAVMTNEQLREWIVDFTPPHSSIRTAILRVLDEHKLMREALEQIAKVSK